MKNRGKILKVEREKPQVIYKGKAIRITADFSKESLKARRTWNDVFQDLKENNWFTLPRKVILHIEGEIKKKIP
jgi:hypothetical protein